MSVRAQERAKLMRDDRFIAVDHLYVFFLIETYLRVNVFLIEDKMPLLFMRSLEPRAIK